MVYGLPGTGKTFFARHLKEESGACHLNTDIIRAESDKKGRYDEKSKQEVYDSLFHLTEEKLKNGHNVIVDGTFHKQERRERIKDIARKTGHPVFFIEIKASDDTVKNRIRPGREVSEADFQVYLKIKEEFEEVSENNLVLWSDRENIETMIKRAREYINTSQ